MPNAPDPGRAILAPCSPASSTSIDFGYAPGRFDSGDARTVTSVAHATAEAA